MSKEKYGVGTIEKCTNNQITDVRDYRVKDKVLYGWPGGMLWLTHFDVIYPDEVPNYQRPAFLTYARTFKKDSNIWVSIFYGD